MKKVMCIVLLAVMLLGTSAKGASIGYVATEEDMTDVIDMDIGALTPVTADMLNEGVYSVSVDSSSAMFKIVDCRLTVLEGTMTARLYMKSKAYSYMNASTAQEASVTAVEKLIPLMEDEYGLYFEMPVEALDSAYICAAYSERKQVWYPRTLVFRSDSLPLEAFSSAYLTTAETLALENGCYECAASIEGKGRMTVLSPALITISQGGVTAHIVFSTSKIDYILLNGKQYMSVATEGGAAFDIPISVFDQKIALVVDSTAIKPATEVPYSLTLFSNTLVPVKRSDGE